MKLETAVKRQINFVEKVKSLRWEVRHYLDTQKIHWFSKRPIEDIAEEKHKRNIPSVVHV